MHVNPTRLALVASACLACLAGGLLAGVATGGLRSEHVLRVETVTTTIRGQVLSAQTVTTTVPQVVTTSETLTTTRVIEVAVRHPRAASTFGAPQDFQAQAVYAVGRLGDPSTLPEALRRREQPSQRRPLKDTVFEDAFGHDRGSAL